MTSIGDVEVRAIIKFCVGIEKTPTETYKMIQASRTTKKCCRSLVFRWHDMFRNGRESREDDKRCGRPSVVKTGVKDKEIKAQLRGRRFDSGWELQIETKRIVSSFDNIWYVDTYDNGSRGIDNVSL
ncbi:protein GVQW3-like [Ruditapes philippinarum]|uniref:protein GVQW3-like n=1 Tax=Ruditapes philippinarum TaxID=129788 RepID=UPI00295C3883|nr:protein GVQW3-like [Ruditapes philippinarum]